MGDASRGERSRREGIHGGGDRDVRPSAGVGLRVRPGPGLTERATCGTTRDVYLQALEYDVTGRGMSGQEAVTMHLMTPSGASHTLSATFAERGSRYRAAVRWWEVGRHEIVATVNGEPVVGQPAGRGG